jgi:hypothetical protein
MDDGCQPCSDDAYMCSEVGLVFPKAAAGNFVAADDESYLQLSQAELRERYHECVPFEACVGTCLQTTLHVPLDDQQPVYIECPGGMDQEICSAGYTGERCAACQEFDDTATDDCIEVMHHPLSGVKYDCAADNDDCVNIRVPSQTGEPNGYYRLNEKCEPCPCTFWNARRIASACFVIAVLTLFVMDHVLGSVKHMSTVVAPLLIIVTFFQTVGLLLSLDVPWPKNLRWLFSWFTFFNLNVEFARPECSGNFGIAEKLYFTLSLPFVLLAVLGVYVAVQLWLSRRVPLTTYRLKHNGKTPYEHLKHQAIAIVTAAFTFGSLFFLQRVLSTWNCTLPETLGGPTFLVRCPVASCQSKD